MLKIKQRDPCVYCNLDISNPVCPSCYYRHLVLWLNDKPVKLNQRIKISKEVKKRLFLENGNELDCILCKKNEVCVCYFCFFKNVEFILNKLGEFEYLIDDFQQNFNYELYSDYTSERNKEKLMKNKGKEE